MKRCPACGHENDGAYVFCMQCGSKLDDNDATVLAKDEDKKDSSKKNDSPVPKTRIAKSLDEVMDLEDEGQDKTQVYHASETRINPQLIQINDDSTEGEIYNITKIKTVIGRNSGDITFPNDTYLSTEHCVLIFDDGKMLLEDMNSFNGVFLKILERTQIGDNSFILMGQQLLHFTPFASEKLKRPSKPETEDIINFYGVSSKKIIGKLTQIFSDKSEGNLYYITHDTVFMGRQSGDISFPDDKFMSNRHAILSHESGLFFIEDNASSNGVFVKIKKKVPLSNGDYLLIGKQLFKYKAPTL